MGLTLWTPLAPSLKQVPLGSVRVSLGYMSTFEDVQALLDFIAARYRNKTSDAFSSV